jgi:uncharacterized protein (DUF433 family)
MPVPDAGGSPPVAAWTGAAHNVPTRCSMFSKHSPERSHGRLTLGEAAALSGIEEKAARRVLNEVLSRSARSLGVRDVLFFLLRRDTLALTTSLDFQRQLYDRVHDRAQHLGAANEVEVELPRGEHGTTVRVAIGLRAARLEALAGVRRLRAGTRRVERRPDVRGGALVFKGTRIPVEQVGGRMLRGEKREVVKDDFPTLTDLDLDFARSWSSPWDPPGVGRGSGCLPGRRSAEGSHLRHGRTAGSPLRGGGTAASCRGRQCRRP